MSILNHILVIPNVYITIEKELSTGVLGSKELFFSIA